MSEVQEPKRTQNWRLYGWSQQGKIHLEPLIPPLCLAKRVCARRGPPLFLEYLLPHVTWTSAAGDSWGYVAFVC